MPKLAIESSYSQSPTWRDFRLLTHSGAATPTGQNRDGGRGTGRFPRSWLHLRGDRKVVPRPLRNRKRESQVLIGTTGDIAYVWPRRDRGRAHSGNGLTLVGRSSSSTGVTSPRRHDTYKNRMMKSVIRARLGGNWSERAVTSSQMQPRISMPMTPLWGLDGQILERCEEWHNEAVGQNQPRRLR